MADTCRFSIPCLVILQDAIFDPNPVKKQTSKQRLTVCRLWEKQPLAASQMCANLDAFSKRQLVMPEIPLFHDLAELLRPRFPMEDSSDDSDDAM